jgi:hypothetical protein
VTIRAMVCYASYWCPGNETLAEGHLRSQDMADVNSMDDAMIYSNVADGHLHVPTRYLFQGHQLRIASRSTGNKFVGIITPPFIRDLVHNATETVL